MLSKPDDLQQKIDYLCGQAEGSLRARLRAGPPKGQSKATQGRTKDAQRNAIDSMAVRLKLDRNRESIQGLGSDLDRLGIRQASQLIDHLKRARGAHR